ncbi:MAG: hypothetical protein IKG46_11395 [Solobacterium sp.]|nr:hypothetical protein [Solobacterium sp.]
MKTMKKLLVCAMALVLTGCFKMRVTFDVTKEGEISGAYRMLVSTSFVESMGANVDDMIADMQQSLQEEYPDGKMTLVNEKIGEDNYAGVEITGIKPEGVKAEVNGNEVKVVIPMNSVEDDITNTVGVDDDSMDISALKQSGLEMTMVINMPGKAKSNVGTVNGNTVTVDLLELPKDTAEITVTSGKGFNILLVVAGVAVVALAGVFAFLKFRK